MPSVELMSASLVSNVLAEPVTTQKTTNKAANPAAHKHRRAFHRTNVTPHTMRSQVSVSRDGANKQKKQQHCHPQHQLQTASLPVIDAALAIDWEDSASGRQDSFQYQTTAWLPPLAACCLLVSGPRQITMAEWRGGNGARHINMMNYA
jgi:hypothetical protein